MSTRKDRLVLAYLALHSGRPVTRDRLAGLLWGDRGNAQARDSLRQSIAAVRQAFRCAGLDPVASERDFLRFSIESIDLDCLRFEVLSRDTAGWEEAAVLYRGPLLDGIDGLTPEYETWLTGERARFNAIAVQLVEDIAGRSRPSEPALCLARQLLAEDPVCEPVCRALMRLHAAKGDRIAALKLHATCCEALKKELNALPDPKTELLYHDILTNRLLENRPAEEAKPTLGRPSIAVLPFSNLSGDAGLDHLCEGLAEDIITGLGRFHLLFVIDRHSSSTIANRETDVAKIGAQLGVAHLVQGSLKRQGDRIRITVRLLDTATRGQIWGEAYDHALSELANAPDEITSALTATLHARVETDLVERSRRKPQLAVYECLLRGLKYLRGYAQDDNERAAELFQRAIDLDPDYALARAYRAFTDVVIHGYSDAPDFVLDRALALASSAVEMDDIDGRCHFLLGLIHRYRGDIGSAGRHFRRARALNPNDANTMVGYARVRVQEGYLDEGLELIRESIRINPYHPQWYWLTLGAVLYEAGRFNDAIEAFSRIVNASYWVHCRIAGCYAELGRTAEAKAAAAKALLLRPEFRVNALRLRECRPEMAEQIRAGLRKAGLPG
jgi:TolB-like protein